jgi:hypothetical protein
MRLTRKILNELEDCMRVTLTPEQRAIMFCWYGNDSKYCCDEEDFAYGIRDVLRYYPDHRPKPMPDFLYKHMLEGEPF